MTSEATFFSNSLPRVTSATGVTDSAAVTDALAAGGKPDTEAFETSTISDELILAQVLEGSKDALGLLFRRHARAVRNTAQRILRDAAEAEDLVQEVFLFVFRKAGLFDPTRGSARSWLIQVAYHRAFDRRRHLASRRFYTHLELEEKNLLTEELQTTVATYQDAIEAAFGQDVLRRIEESLSEVQKRVVRLRFFDGYTMEEIGKILGESSGNARNHYYRALERMRKEVFGSKLKTK